MTRPRQPTNLWSRTERVLSWKAKSKMKKRIARASLAKMIKKQQKTATIATHLHWRGLTRILTWKRGSHSCRRPPRHPQTGSQVLLAYWGTKSPPWPSTSRTRLWKLSVGNLLTIKGRKLAPRSWQLMSYFYKNSTNECIRRVVCYRIKWLWTLLWRLRTGQGAKMSKIRWQWNVASGVKILSLLNGYR